MPKLACEKKKSRSALYRGEREISSLFGAWTCESEGNWNKWGRVNVVSESEMEDGVARIIWPLLLLTDAAF